GSPQIAASILASLAARKYLVPRPIVSWCMDTRTSTSPRAAGGSRRTAAAPATSAASPIAARRWRGGEIGAARRRWRLGRAGGVDDHLGRGAGLVEVARQRRDGLERLQGALLAVVGAGGHRRVALVQHVGVAAARVEGQVARPRPGRLDEVGDVVGAELAAG